MTNTLKHLLILFVLFLSTFALSQQAEAQVSSDGQDRSSLKPLKEVGVSSGSGVIASGLDFYATFSMNACRMSFRGNNTPRFIIKTGCSTLSWLQFDVTGGAYENVPWAGPQVAVSKKLTDRTSFLSLFWIGWSAGDDTPSMSETQLMFWQWSSFLDLQLYQLRSEAKNGQKVSLTASYTYFNFKIVGRDVPQSLVGATFNFPLGKRGLFKLGIGGVKDVLDGPVRLKASLSFTPEWGL